jgi:chromosome segregation ATPase
VELRSASERLRTAELDWNRRVAELTADKKKLELEKAQWEKEKRELSEQIARCQQSTATSNADKNDSKPTAELDELLGLKAKHEAECGKEKTRLERELKMLNETLYSTVAAKNKSIQECRSLTEQLQIEREKFAEHRDMKRANGGDGVSNESGGMFSNAERTRLVDEVSRLKVEVATLTRQNAAAAEQLGRLMAEKQQTLQEQYSNISRPQLALQVCY